MSKLIYEKMKQDRIKRGLLQKAQEKRKGEEVLLSPRNSSFPLPSSSFQPLHRRVNLPWHNVARLEAVLFMLFKSSFLFYARNADQSLYHLLTRSVDLGKSHLRVHLSHRKNSMADSFLGHSQRDDAEICASHSVIAF